MHVLTPDELVTETCNSLSAPSSGDATSLIKAALRRASIILAPSGRADLVRFVALPLRPLGVLVEAVEGALDELVVYGDILELHRLASDSWDAPAHVLRPAPPSFVRRQDGDFIILGVAGDHPTPLTAELQARVLDDGRVRKLRALPGEDLSAHLRLLGLVQLSEQAWLRSPPAEPAVALAGRWRTMLATTRTFSTTIDGLEILDAAKPVRYYRGRWTAPGPSHSGTFVGRRGQLYGAPLWSVVELDVGSPRRLVDITSDDDRQRPCDLAWRLQAALDASRGAPQQFRVRADRDSSFIDFFSPLPAFAERRLALVASKVAAGHCLFSFQMPTNRLSSEVAALQASLWMSVTRDKATP